MSECGKMKIRITPNTDAFYAVIFIHLTLEKIFIPSENFTEYYLRIKEYFDMLFSTPKHIPQVANKKNH